MPKNVTFIDDLFDADAVSSGGDNDDYISKGNQERDAFSGQIRNRHIRAHEKDHSYAMNGGVLPPTHSMNHSMNHSMGMGMNHNMNHGNGMNQVREDFTTFVDPEYQYAQFFQQPSQQMPSYLRKQTFEEPEISCMRIATHIRDCPICSKFYNCDNSMYIVCIVLLAIICIILLKRIIDK
jgi:hypothetical protein